MIHILLLLNGSPGGMYQSNSSSLWHGGLRSLWVDDALVLRTRNCPFDFLSTVEYGLNSNDTIRLEAIMVLSVNWTDGSPGRRLRWTGCELGLTLHKHQQASQPGREYIPCHFHRFKIPPRPPVDKNLERDNVKTRGSQEHMVNGRGDFPMRLDSETVRR